MSQSEIAMFTNRIRSAMTLGTIDHLCDLLTDQVPVRELYATRQGRAALVAIENRRVYLGDTRFIEVPA